MFIRLLLVIAIMVVVVAGGLYFADDLAMLAQRLWALDNTALEKTKNWIEIGTQLIAGLVFIFTVPSLIYQFIKGQAEKKKPAEGNTTIFNDEVHIGNDFIQGNKTTNKDDQNAG